MAPNYLLFNQSTLAKLEQLTLAAGSIRVGALKGDRRSRKKGTSIEFSDYRDYAQGDDLRRLDWNIYARLERPFIKVTQDEEDLAVHILVDTSSSMNWPREDFDASYTLAATNKLLYSFRIAGALGIVGLLTGDLVTANLFDRGSRQVWGPFRSRQNSWPLLQFLEANYRVISAENSEKRPRKTDLDLSLRDYALRARRPGLLVLISDLLAPGRDSGSDYQAGIQALLSRGYEVAIIHVLSPDETSPASGGDLKLVDVETGEEAEITLDADLLQDYSQRLSAWTAAIQAYCRSRGVRYVPVTTDQPWDAFVISTLRREGVTT
ncbi:MAG: DUF58 domain-containing protein [Chloroflexota bacterium]